MIYSFLKQVFFLFRSRTAFLSIFLIGTMPISSQGLSPLAEDFMAGLPPSVREELEVQNQVDDEAELDKLFRSDTSIEKNKVILRNLEEELKALKLRLDNDDTEVTNRMQRFGDSFFQTFQSSFMPVNVPNIGSNYVVDVGDVFKFTRSGQKNTDEDLMVGRDGSLVIIGSGKLQVAGRTLAQVEEMVNSLVKATQIGVSHMLALKELRDVQVIIVGAVENPGIYTLSGGSSVVGGLHVAGGINQSGSFRNIELRRNNKAIATFDLYDLFVFGQYDNQNTLRSGDTIFVHPSKFQVPVAGGVNNSAIYELTDDENLKDLIGFAGGFNETFYGFNKVLVTRNLPQKRTLEAVPVEQLDSFMLRPRDSVMVPSYSYKSNDLYKVTIEGRVKRPGTYFVLPGETLEMLVMRAGGYEKDAYEYGAALFRETAIDQEEIFAQLNYADTLNFIVSSLGKPGVNVSSGVLGLLAEEVRAENFQGRVITEFNINTLKSKPELNMPLQHNDRIVVPSLQKIVYMFGDFRNTLNASYQPKNSVNDYIKQAGGLKDSAYSELIIIDPDGKTQIYSKNFLNIGRGDINIYPGSIIYAPRNISKISGMQYAATISPVISSVALSLASLNSISN